MFASFDEKGKIFTNVVSKEPVDAIVQTTSHQIHGKVYIRPDDRLKDELNRGEVFLAITDATVYGSHGEAVFRTNFITVHRDHVIWLIPVSELQSLEGNE